MGVCVKRFPYAENWKTEDGKLLILDPEDNKRVLEEWAIPSGAQMAFVIFKPGVAFQWEDEGYGGDFTDGKWITP